MCCLFVTHLETCTEGMEKPVLFYFGKFQTLANIRLALEAIKILTLALFTSLYFLPSPLPPMESMILCRLKCCQIASKQLSCLLGSQTQKHKSWKT